jgi:hypothetical protein
MAIFHMLVFESRHWNAPGGTGSWSSDSARTRTRARSASRRPTRRSATWAARLPLRFLRWERHATNTACGLDAVPDTRDERSFAGNVASVFGCDTCALLGRWVIDDFAGVLGDFADDADGFASCFVGDFADGLCCATDGACCAPNRTPYAARCTANAFGRAFDASPDAVQLAQLCRVTIRRIGNQLPFRIVELGCEHRKPAIARAIELPPRYRSGPFVVKSFASVIAWST